MTTIKNLMFLLLFSAFLACNSVEKQVAEDQVKQYEIAVKNGTDMDAYVQAGMVAEAYLQAKDSVNYKKWKEVEKQWAKKVGL